MCASDGNGLIMDIDINKWIRPVSEKYIIQMMDCYDESPSYWSGNEAHDTLEQAVSFADQRIKAMYGQDTVAYGKYEAEWDENGNPEPIPIRIAYRIIKKVVTEEVVSSYSEAREIKP